MTSPNNGGQEIILFVLVLIILASLKFGKTVLLNFVPANTVHKVFFFYPRIYMIGEVAHRGRVPGLQERVNPPSWRVAMKTLEGGVTRQPGVGSARVTTGSFSSDNGDDNGNVTNLHIK